MKKLLIVLAILAVIAALALVGLAYADVEAREYAEQEAERRLAAAVPMAAGADVEIDAFPFVGWVLVDGSVERLDVELTDLSSEGITVERISLAVDGLELDRDKLLEDRTLAIIGLKRAQLQASITSDAVNRVTPVPTRIRGGKVEVDYKGHTFEGTIRLQGHDVMIGVPGIKELRVPLPDKKFLPCDPEINLDGDRLRVACTLHELPDAVADMGVCVCRPPPSPLW